MESDGRQHPVHLSPNERYNTPVILYVTVCAKDRKPILANPVVHAWLIRTWQENAGWLVGRYMIMPDHIHFFCAPAENPPSAFTAWMKRWKSFPQGVGHIGSKLLFGNVRLGILNYVGRKVTHRNGNTSLTIRCAPA